MSVVIRPAHAEDADQWCRLRAMLWPDAEAGEHACEIADYFAGRFPRSPWLALLAVDSGQRVVGFAEVSTRLYAEGCATTPVAYLEGWFVDAKWRCSGIGRDLVEAAADWGRAQGCAEFASDADPGNAVSVSAHQAVGFQDVGLVRCFRRSLGSDHSRK